MCAAYRHRCTIHCISTAQERAPDVPHTTTRDQKLAHVQRTRNTWQTLANKGQEIDWDTLLVDAATMRKTLDETLQADYPCRDKRQVLEESFENCPHIGSKLAKNWSPRPIVSLSKSKEKIDHVPQLVQVAPKAHIVHCSVPADKELNE